MRRPPPKQQPMTNFLLQAIKTCGKSVYQLAEEADLDLPLIYQFLKGKSSLGLTTADRLVNALNLELSARVKAPHK